MKIAIIDSGVGLVHLLKLLQKAGIKQDFHLLFSSFFPVGDAEEARLIAEGKRLANLIEAEKYDRAIICCNTLSFYLPSNPKYIKILALNRQYLERDPEALLVATHRTVQKLGRGYADQELVKAIENGDEEMIMGEIRSWPKARKYLLGCTHFSLIREKAEELHPESQVVDLIEKLFEIVAAWPQEERSRYDYGEKEEQIKKFLKF